MHQLATNTMETIWLLLSLVVTPTFCQRTVTLSLITTTLADYYEGEELTIICTARGYTDPTLLALYNGTSRTDYNKRNACLYGGGAWLGGDALSTVLEFSPITDAYCDNAAKSEPFILETTGTISDKVVGTYSCDAEGDNSVVTASTTHDIASVKQHPTGLSMTVDGSTSDIVVKEGVEFTLKCTSTGADPESLYEYTIYRGSVDDNNIIHTSTPTNLNEYKYTPTSADREGITLQCTDTQHPNWKTEEDIKKTSALIRPQYIEGDEDVKPDVKLNPLVENTRECTITGYPTIEYVWTCDSCPENTTNGNILTLGKGATVGSKSNITCTGTVTGVGSRTQGWLVTWTHDATTPSTTTTNSATTPPPGGLEIWIIIVIIVVILVGLVVVVVVIIGLLVYFGCFCCAETCCLIVLVTAIIRCCCKGKDDVNSTTNKEKDKNGTDPESVSMTECGDKPDSKMPGKPKHQNSSKRPKTKPKQPETPKPQPTQYTNDPIIYAELDHSQQPKGQVKPAQPKTPVAPPDAVEYTSIDMLKTDRAKQKPNGNPDSGEAYENLGNQSKASKAGKAPAEQPVYAEVDKKKPKSNGNGKPDTGETYENLGRSGKATGSSMPRNNAPAPPTNSPGAGRYGNV